MADNIFLTSKTIVSPGMGVYRAVMIKDEETLQLSRMKTNNFSRITDYLKWYGTETNRISNISINMKVFNLKIWNRVWFHPILVNFRIKIYLRNYYEAIEL